ncbi:putative redox-active protein [Caprobacter fermentans]|uniref:Putative redox-active protein n=1 Tax=Caproicibacter fermentans TaxID=2576756 RepID=A0A6N8HZQ1_9FIRM|nr:C-GCAxxG-C-C family (seleno)protein [Caproicibacter fermentans]MVB10957.1 putative redox-active protein [Caproicibacter fermentans]
MLRDRVRDYYLLKDNNCAETALHAIDDEYRLNLSEESFKLIGGFGGGMGCGKACGALCACVAALGEMTIEERAHATPEFKERCAALVEKFTEKLGDTECCELTKKYKKEDTRCLDTVLLAADAFEEFLKEKNA